MEGYDNSFNSWIDKKYLVQMSSEYSPFYSAARYEIVEVKLNLSGYITQKEFKSLTGNINISDFVLKVNVADLKDSVDKIVQS